MTHSQLHWPSTDLEALKARLHRVDEFLIIQDLDGVCMGLVNDPLTRRIEPGYLHAVSRLKGRFFVLTNGEHIGCRGVNGIVDRALSESDAEPEDHGLYLPGLAAGGVQWQTAVQTPPASGAATRLRAMTCSSCRSAVTVAT